MITWSHNTGVYNQHSCHAITWLHREKQKWTKHHRTKAPKDQNQGGQNPQKWENILRLQQLRCTIPWSHDTGVDNQHSHHAITCAHREKQKWTKAPQDESPKRSESRRTKPPKWENILRLQQLRCTIPWSHNTGVNNQHSRHAITFRQREKPKWTKAPKDQDQGGQNPPKWENILRLQQSRCTIPWSHDTGLDNQHSCDVITWPHREKQKWTKAPQDESPKRSETRRTKNPEKWESIL